MKPDRLGTPLSSREIGERLIAAGWKQGSVLPALSHAALFLPGTPSSATSKAEKPYTTVPKGENDLPSYGIATQPQGTKKRFVVVSQICDIARDSETEPFVDVALGFYSTGAKMLADARSSTRFFLLNEQTGLIVDIRYQAQIEKALLETFAPVDEIPDEEIARRFRYWLGDRRSRPAFPDGYIAHVRNPMRERLRALQAAADPVLSVLDHILEVRTVMPDDSEPYPADFVILLDATSDPDEEKAFKTGAFALFGKLVDVLSTEHVRTSQVLAFLANEWSVHEYFATEPIDVI